MSLDRDDVIDAAVQILDEYGLGDLSMRRVADVLEVKAGALYWHVANKQTLLAAVADRILGEVPAVDPAVDPGSALSAWAHGLRGVLLAHRDSADLVATALASGLCRADPLVRLAPVFGGAAGAKVARWSSGALLDLVLGAVAREQNALLFAQLGKSVAADSGDQARAFSHGVEALVRGLLAADLDVKE
ncbi:TetR family transcriptional regulator [Luteococcus japonicus]|uniref:TetR family transcriptional regulator n=1 Tax=Luteococcus japonicus TaxID=33984 RepID=A0A3N1ZYB8_9ACTN|nr:TetR family transcriptional regulator [Luteococcus japonicus]ROR55840.1 TetR family transcriptional regulator [Luteococcus japonicus]